ncbi:MAG: two-component regulator propeller domain-containing protein [Blastocatellia bacterium]|nr:two-component regulator propeller domain-containing protein [Blastocatellia bacterium]
MRRAIVRAAILLAAWPAMVCGIFDAEAPVRAQGPETVRYGHTVWQTEQGLPQNTAPVVLQTRNGYLWIGTKDGLARFDGIRFTTFDKRSAPELPHNEIRALYEDRAGSLWISTPGGLVQFRQGRFTAFTTRDGLANNEAGAVFEDRAGNLWIGTPDGLNRVRDGKFTTYTTRDGISHNSIGKIVEDRDGTLWIGTAAGLTRFRDGAFTRYSRREGLAGDAVTALLIDLRGRLWIGTTEGLTVYADGRFQSYTRRDGLLNDSILAIAQDSTGRLWFGTPGGLNEWRNGSFASYTTRQGLPGERVDLLHAGREGRLWIGASGGLARFWNGRLAAFAGQEGLAGNRILALCEDREGSLWVGTEAGGLSQLSERKFTSHTTRQGLSANLVRAIYEDRAGGLWVGTQAGLNQFREGGMAPVPGRPGRPEIDLQAIAEDRDGALWLGTPQGLMRWRPGTGERTYTVRDGLIDDQIRSLLVDRAGSLWIGTRKGLARFREGRFASFTVLDGLGSDLIGPLCEGRDGSLWIGTIGGVSRFKEGAISTWTSGAGLANETVTALYEDADGVLWIGTRGGGLNRFRDGRFTQFTLKDGLPDDVIHHILEDDAGYLWMSSNKGVIRVSREELNARQAGETRPINQLLYGTADGMETRECSGGGSPAGWKTRDGRLWFATVKGAAVIDPLHLRLNAQPPAVVIEQVVVDEQPLSLAAPVDVPPGKARIEFYYAGLSFAAPAKVAFKYRLEGFDPDWIDAGTRRVASYTNVPAGSYRFRVQASNNDGVWNLAGAALDLRLRPHFYRTWWFYGLCLLTLALGGWGWYRARVRRIEREFSAVLAERTRIAREIHDTLAQGFAGISVQLELVARMLAVAPQNARTHLDEARALVRDSLAEARRSVWDLRSQALEERDLPAALGQIARRLIGGGAIEVQVEVHGAFRRLDRAIEDHLLRIGQEAMTNVVKHAAATRIAIELTYEEKTLRLCVRDNGRGFDAATLRGAADGHFGLLGMRERAAQLGGRLTVSSRPHQGTEVSVEIPLGG